MGVVRKQDGELAFGNLTFRRLNEDILRYYLDLLSSWSVLYVALSFLLSVESLKLVPELIAATVSGYPIKICWIVLSSCQTNCNFRSTVIVENRLDISNLVQESFHWLSRSDTFCHWMIVASKSGEPMKTLHSLIRHLQSIFNISVLAGQWETRIWENIYSTRMPFMTRVTNKR